MNLVVKIEKFLAKHEGKNDVRWGDGGCLFVYDKNNKLIDRFILEIRSKKEGFISCSNKVVTIE